MWLTLDARMTFGTWLSSGTWLLVLLPHVITVGTPSSPLNITCFTNGSINVLQNNTNNPEIFVVGSRPACSDAEKHFTVDSRGHLLNTSCKASNGYILQVLDFNKTKATGFTLTVYNVSCDNGTASQVNIAPARYVPYLEEVALPTLHMVILPANTALNTSMTSSCLGSMYLGQEVMLTIYNDRSQGRASYMLVPTLCEAYPADNSTVRLTLLKQEGSSSSSNSSQGCTKQDAVIGQFTIEKLNDVDVAWAPLYGFKFVNYPDSDLIIDCTVLVCPATSTLRKGRCMPSNGPSNSCYKMPQTQGYNKRRKRYVGMSRDIVHAERGLTARTRIKLKYN